MIRDSNQTILCFAFDDEDEVQVINQELHVHHHVRIHVLVGHIPEQAHRQVNKIINKIRTNELQVNETYNDNNNHLYSVIIERRFNPQLNREMTGVTICVFERPTRAVYVN